MSKATSNRQAAAVFLLTGILFLCLTLATPPGHDDLNYCRVFEAPPELSPQEISYRFITCQGRPISSFGDLINSVENHYRYFNNARFANFIAFALCSGPQWVSDLLSTVFFIVFLLLLYRIGFGKILTPKKAMATIGLCALLLSWTAPMISTDFLINYLWTATLSMFLVWLLVTRFDKVSLWLMIPLGFITGGMHELFTATFGVALIILLARQKTLKSYRAIALLSAYFAAGALIFFSPAMRSRINEILLPEISLTVIIKALISFSGAIAALIIITVARRRIAIYLPWLAMIAVNIGVCCAVGDFGGRLAWPANLAGAIILMKVFADSKICRSKWLAIADIAVYAGVSLFMVFWIFAQLQESTLQKQLHSDIWSSGDSPIAYSDATDMDVHPFFLKDYITGRCIIDNYAAQAPNCGRLKAVLPNRLRNLPVDSLPITAGTAHCIEAFPYFISQKEYSHLKLTYAPAEKYNLSRIPFSKEIIRLFNGRRIIDANTTIVTVLSSEEIAPKRYVNYALPQSPLYSGRKIIRIDTVAPR